MGGAWGGGLKMLSKNTCEGVHLIVKLPAITCKPAHLLNTHILEGFELDFKLLFIVLFLGMITWKGASRFSGGGGRGGLAFRWGSFLFRLKGGAPMGDIGFDGGVRKKL